MLSELLQDMLLSFGIAGIAAGICAALFGRRNTALAEPELLDRMQLENPDFRAGLRAVSIDARAALVENADDGSVHLIVVHGDKFVWRKLGLLRNLVVEGSKLSIRLADFTLPTASLVFSDAMTAHDWGSRLRRAAL
jgi:hypothetical protein